MSVVRWLIVAVSVFAVITIATTYAVAKHLGDLDLTVPFISGSIDYPPESCIGTLGLTTCSTILWLVIVIKYKHNMTLINAKFNQGPFTDPEYIRQQRHARIAVFLGSLSCYSLNGVASFQFHLEPVVHVIFAILFFLPAIVYGVLATRIDYKLAVLPLNLLRLRAGCTILSLVLFVPFFIFQFLPGDYKELNAFLSTSATCEIAITFLFFFYFVSYWPEFTRLDVTFAVHTSLLVPSMGPSASDPLLPNASIQQEKSRQANV